MNNCFVRIGDNNQLPDEIIDFLARIYGPNYYDAKRIQGLIIRSEPSTSPQNFVLARSIHNELIGIIRIVDRKIHLGSAILKCGGISSVSVHPDWRGQGIVREMMNVAHEAMVQRGMDISFLYARRVLDGYYTQFGYYGINRYLDLEIISAIAGEEKLNIAPFRQENMGTISVKYNDAYSGLPGSIVRDEKMWVFLISRIKETGGSIRLLECCVGESGEMIGYLIISNDKLIEISVPSVFFPYLPILIKKLGLKYISIHPCHPFFKYVRTNFSTIQHERFSLDGGYMGKILDYFSLFSKICPDIRMRVSKIMDADTVKLFGYELELQSGEISKAAGQDDIILENKNAIIQFVLGIHCLEDYFGVSLNPEKPWLKYLFPYTGFHTSALDEI